MDTERISNVFILIVDNDNYRPLARGAALLSREPLEILILD